MGLEGFCSMPSGIESNSSVQILMSGQGLMILYQSFKLQAGTNPAPQPLRQFLHIPPA